MSKIKTILWALIAFVGQANAQTETVHFSKNFVDDFWLNNDAPTEGVSIGVVFDSAYDCNGFNILSGDSGDSLSAFLKQANPRFNLEYVNYGKFGKENLLVSSVCGHKNSNEIAWNIFKLNKSYKRMLTEKEKQSDNKSKYKTIKCFESSNGISLDQPSNKDIWVFVYTSSTYNMEEKVADYSRKGPYPYCDNFHKYEAQ
jgi:hypothetical protein